MGKRRSWVAGALALLPLSALLAGCVDPALPDVLVLQDGTIIQPTGSGAALVGGRSGSRGSAPEDLSAESVLGTDERVPANVDTYPGRAVGALTRYGPPFCTAVLVAPDVAITAGHCVHEGGAEGQWLDGLRFAPGRDGSVEPYGSCRPAPNGLAVLQGFTRDADENYDLGIIRLDCRIGERVGWLGLVWSAALPADGLAVMLQGYSAAREVRPFRSPFRSTIPGAPAWCRRGMDVSSSSPSLPDGPPGNWRRPTDPSRARRRS